MAKPRAKNKLDSTLLVVQTLVEKVSDNETVDASDIRRLLYGLELLLTQIVNEIQTLKELHHE